MAMLDLIEDGGQLSGQPLGQPDAEDLADAVGGEAPQADLSAALEDLVNGKVTLEDEIATVLHLGQSVEAGQIHLAAFFFGELGSEQEAPVIELFADDLRGLTGRLPPAEQPRRRSPLAAFGSQRDRYGSAEEVQTHSGIAPVMEKSGKKKWVHFRWACPKFLRQSFHEWAGHSISQSTWARAYYQQQRGRGKDHQAAVRALAFKWIRILFRCWQDRVAY